MRYLARALCKEAVALETKAAAGPRAYVQVVRGPDAGCQKTAVREADRKDVFGVSDQGVS